MCERVVDVLFRCARRGVPSSLAIAFVQHLRSSFSLGGDEVNHALAHLPRVSQAWWSLRVGLKATPRWNPAGVPVWLALWFFGKTAGYESVDRGRRPRPACPRLCTNGRASIPSLTFECSLWQCQGGNMPFPRITHQGASRTRGWWSRIAGLFFLPVDLLD